MKSGIKTSLAHIAWTLVFLIPFAAYALLYYYGTGQEVRFVYPWILILMIALPFILILQIMQKRRSARISFSQYDVLRAAGSGLRVKLLPMLTGVRITALALIILAAARPQDAEGRDKTELEGIDIVISLDMSGSMKAADLEPTRLEAAKAVVADFIKRRRTDRIGMVIFGQDAYTLCPLTLDYSALTSMLSGLTLGDISGDATAIGNSLGTALARLRQSDALSRVIILLTDGNNNAGQITPEQAAEFARTLGVQIYTILMGQEDDAPVEVGVDLFGRKMYSKQRFPVNPELLSSISARTGGRFFRATDRGGLERSFHEILNALEKSRVEDIGVMYSEAFGRFLTPALFLLLFELLLRLFVLRRVP